MIKSRPINLILNGIRILLVTIVFIAFSSCSEEAQYEKALKKAVIQYLNKNLKDPGSLKDLEISYAILSQEEIDAFRDKQLEEYKANPSETEFPLATLANEKEAIVLVKYRAKNSFGAYDKGLDAFKFLPFGNELLDLQSLKKYELYLLDAMYHSPNKKELK